VACHTQTEFVSELIGLGVDSVEHGTMLTSDDIDLLGARGGAWTPTLSAAYQVTGDIPDDGYRVAGEFTERMRELLPRAGCGHYPDNVRSPASQARAGARDVAARGFTGQRHIAIESAPELLTRRSANAETNSSRARRDSCGFVDCFNR
jgi:hypothetical protein